MKNIKTIMLALAIGLSLIACKEKEVKTEVVYVSPLLGFYKYKSVKVPIAVDLNKDGIFNNNLKYEDKEHIFDNVLIFASYGKGQIWKLEIDKSLNDYSTISEFEYVFDEENRIIKMTHKNGLIEIFKNVKISDGKTIFYEMWDESIKQVVTCNLESHDF
jgi:hypothetical protein